MKAILARFRAWWHRGIKPGSNPSPEQLQAMRGTEDEIRQVWGGML